MTFIDFLQQKDIEQIFQEIRRLLRTYRVAVDVTLPEGLPAFLGGQGRARFEFTLAARPPDEVRAILEREILTG